MTAGRVGDFRLALAKARAWTSLSDYLKGYSIFLFLINQLLSKWIESTLLIKTIKRAKARTQPQPKAEASRKEDGFPLIFRNYRIFKP